MFKVGHKMKGWYVNTDKNGRKRWVRQGCWFVVYKINPNAKEKGWKYPSHVLLGDWYQVGKGEGSVKYPREEQFEGDQKYTARVRQQPRAFFDDLKAKGVVAHYKIAAASGLKSILRQMPTMIKIRDVTMLAMDGKLGALRITTRQSPSRRICNYQQLFAKRCT